MESRENGIKLKKSKELKKELKKKYIKGIKVVKRNKQVDKYCRGAGGDLERREGGRKAK